MKPTNLLKHFIILLFIICGTHVFSQKNMTVQKGSMFKISGTSSLHDWDMNSETATGRMVGTFHGESLQSIQSLVVEMPAESLKSGKGGMDKNAYKALKTTSFKTIKFELKSAKKEGAFWNLTGTFQIAGVTKNVSIKVKESNNGGEVVLEGSYDFNLTDYNITPPTALLGTVKTGDAVSISFKISFK
ncbi:MAG: YceI family protein [Flavobacterium sp.]